MVSDRVQGSLQAEVLDPNATDHVSSIIQFAG
jgi:hypothetical protein